MATNIAALIADGPPALEGVGADHLQQMFEQSPLGLLLYDRSGHVVAFNATFEREWARCSGGLEPQYAAALREALGGARVMPPPVRYWTAGAGSGMLDDQVRWAQVHVYPLLDAGGLVDMVVVAHQDVTVQQKCEEELRGSIGQLTMQNDELGQAALVAQEAKSRFRALADALPQMIWLADASGQMLWRNESWCEYAENGRDESIDIARAIGEMDQWKKALAEGRACEFEANLPDAKGVSRPFAVSVIPIRGEGDGIRHWVGVCADVSRYQAEIRERERRIDVEHGARKAAEGANQTKSDFLATMSHELRTPLNAIAGYADLLLLEVSGALNPEQRGYVERICHGEQYLLGLINDILNHAKIEAGSVEYHCTDISAGPTLSEVDSLLRPQAQEKGVILESESPGDGIVVYADPDRLRQILLNLGTNAIRATPSGGRVSVRGSKKRGEVLFTVSDTGKGIPSDKLEEIFKPFVQLQRGEGAGGAGLGLAISRDLSRGMGGTLAAASVDGAGSVFTLTLPLGRRRP